MTITDWIQAISTVILAIITGIYAWRTHVISKATEKQADASVKMAEEMREQNIISSRPRLFQRVVNGTSDSYFEIYNAGNGTAVDVQVYLLNQTKMPTGDILMRGFLLASESPLIFHANLANLTANQNRRIFYVVSQYQDISCDTSKPTWYQTWLPCELSVTDKVIAYGQKFYNNVPENKRLRIVNTELDEWSKSQ